MGNLERMFSELTGRKATPDELDELRRIRDTMRLSEKDAVWYIVILFQSQVPPIAALAGRIEQATELYQKAIQQASAQAEKIMEGARSAALHAKIDPDVEPVSTWRVARSLLGVCSVAWGAYALYDWGNSDAIDQLGSTAPRLPPGSSTSRSVDIGKSSDRAKLEDGFELPQRSSRTFSAVSVRGERELVHA